VSLNDQDSTINYQDVDRLLEQGFLDEAGAARAKALLIEPASVDVWHRDGRRALLGLGLFQVLAGVIFFFAANWSLLSKWERLAPIFAVMFVCGVVAWTKHGTLTGRLCLTAATVLVGVFMAVFGQIYQTGADAWTLFATWSGLTLVWVYAAAFPPLWFVWLLISETALFLLSKQVLGVSGHVGVFLCACLAGIGLLSLIIRAQETSRWVHRTLIVNALGALSIPALHGVVEWTDTRGTPFEYVDLIALGLAVISIVAILVGWQLKILRDLFTPAIALAFAMALFTTFIFSFEYVREPLFIGFVMALEVAASGAWLRRQWREQSQ
jgi:hypothetical protein